MLKKRWFGYISAYFFWAVSLALLTWFLILARNTLPAWVEVAISNNPTLARQLAVILDKVLILVGGIGWLVFLIVIEQYFRKGIARGKLWVRIARVLGILLILIFLVDGSQVLLSQILITMWTNWLILLLELALGVGLIYLSRRSGFKPPNGPTRSS